MHLLFAPTLHPSQFNHNRTSIISTNPDKTYLLAYFETKHVPNSDHVQIPRSLRTEPRFSFLKWEITKTTDGRCCLLLNADAYMELSGDNLQRFKELFGLHYPVQTLHETVESFPLHTNHLQLHDLLPVPINYHEILGKYLRLISSDNVELTDNLEILANHLMAIGIDYRDVTDIAYKETLELIDSVFTEAGISDKSELFDCVTSLRASAKTVRFGVEISQYQMMALLVKLKELESVKTPNHGEIQIPPGSTTKIANGVNAIMGWYLNLEYLQELTF